MRRGAIGLALVGALALAAAEPTTIASVDVPGASCTVVYDQAPELAERCDLSGFERHGGALVLLALVAAAAALVMARGAHAPAGGVLVVVGAVALGIALIGDLPETNETGALGLNFEGATASAGLGFYLELTGSVLCILAGVLALGSTSPTEPRPDGGRGGAGAGREGPGGRRGDAGAGRGGPGSAASRAEEPSERA